ncbi:TPA: ead/Ea22-like family protein [Citrobacter sedlakii]
MSNIDKQALRVAAEKALPAMQRLLMMPNDELFDEALLNVDGDVDAANAFNLLSGPETVLALLDELEAKDKQVAELQARDQPKFVQCWSCKRAIEVLAIADCDGYCPRCAAPIDLDDEPYAAGIGKGE